MNVVNHVLKGKVYRVTSPFGMRRLTIGGRTSTSMHHGIDLVPRDHIIAPAKGMVIKVRTNVLESQTKSIIEKKQTSLYRGNYIILQHGNGVKTYYVHLAHGSIPAKIKVGSIVEKGDILGYMGTTGYSTGVHLHFEVREGNTPVDPAPYLTGAKNFQDYSDIVLVNRDNLPKLKIHALSLNFRDRPDGTRLGTLPQNAELPYLGKTTMIAGYEWAEVLYEGKIVYCALQNTWNTIENQTIVKEVVKTVEVVKPINETFERNGLTVTIKKV